MLSIHLPFVLPVKIILDFYNLYNQNALTLLFNLTLLTQTNKTNFFSTVHLTKKSKKQKQEIYVKLSIIIVSEENQNEYK